MVGSFVKQNVLLQIRKYVFKASGTRFSGREAAQLAIKSR